MKYEMQDFSLTKEQRGNLNAKIIHLLSNNTVEQNNVTPEEIGSLYSGMGGLHGLTQMDYHNYASFSMAKKEKEQGQFFTPYAITDFVMKILQPSADDIIMDLTCGKGSFFNSCPNEENLYGCEVDYLACKVAKYLYPKMNLYEGDIRAFKPPVMADIVVGNPPFNLKWKVRDGSTEYQVLSQLYYCEKAAELLKPFGLMAIVIPESFLKDEFFEQSRFDIIEKYFNILFEFDFPETAFNTYGLNFKTKLIVMQRTSVALKCFTSQTEGVEMRKIPVPTLEDERAQILHDTYIKPLLRIKKEKKANLFLEQARNAHMSSSFEYKLKKLVFDVQRHGKISKITKQKCEQFVHKFFTQKQPPGVDWEEWQKTKITENKVLGYLTRALKSVNDKPEDKIRLVRHKDRIYSKAYSKKSNADLKRAGNSINVSVNSCIYNSVSPAPYDTEFDMFLRRRAKEFEAQNTPWADMEQNEQVEEFIDSFELFDKSRLEYIKLNTKQSIDVNLFIQKRYSYIQWEQGSGNNTCII